MQDYITIIVNSYKGYAGYLWNEITHPTIHSYFYWLIGISLLFFTIEVVLPWRKNQSKIRRDFWLDGFYMFFNFFLFSLIIYNAASDLVVNVFNDVIVGVTGFNLQASNPIRNLPMWSILLIGFVVRDFIQWWIHRLLHRVPKLWEFHKVHHSVQEMGFAAHLRYHWMENVVYRSLEYIPLALLGIGLYDFFIIHLFTLAWGHFNHSNFSISGYWTGGIVGLLIGLMVVFSMADLHVLEGSSFIVKGTALIGITAVGSIVLGPLMKKVFNSPEFHIWHHSYELPEDKKYGVNFALTLALWDNLFGTAHNPYDGRDIKLGFPGVEEFPENFAEQNIHGILR